MKKIQYTAVLEISHVFSIYPGSAGIKWKSNQENFLRRLTEAKFQEKKRKNWLMAVSNPGLSHFHIPKGVAHFIFPLRLRFAKVRFLTVVTT